MLNLRRLSLDPSEGLESLEKELVLGKKSGKLDGGVGSSLRDVNDGLDLLDLRVVGWRRSVEVGSDLSSKIGVDDEGFEDVLGNDEGEGSSVVLDVVVRDEDVLDSEGKVRRRDGSNSEGGRRKERGRKEEEISGQFDATLRTSWKTHRQSDFDENTCCS